MDIWETIKMFNNHKNITLSDLINIGFLQELQDNFADTMGVASITVDNNGPITKPSNFTNFCTNHILANELGAQKCNKCDIEGGQLALEKGEPVIYTCHAGLTHFVVPIIVKGKHIASILGGQISTVKPNEAHFKNVAKNLGILAESEYIQDLRKVKIIPEENIKAATKLLSLVANSISQIAHKNYELIEKNEREKILIGVNNKIRNSLELEEIKNDIVTLIGNFINADRVVIAYYDYKINNYVITKESEYRSSDKVKTFVGVDFTGMPGFAEFIRNIHFQGKDIIFNDLEKYLDENDFRNTGIETFYRDFGFTSSAAINMSYENKFLGDLVITFENRHDFSEDEINFLRATASQAGVAFHQAEMYLTTKLQAEREFLLRNITETIRSTLDIKETKKRIVDIVGKTLNLDRCFITEYDAEKDKFMIVEDEYTCSNDVVCYKGSDSNVTIPRFTEAFKEGKSLLINNKEIFLDVKDKNFDLEMKSIDRLNIKAGFSCPLYYKNELLGVLSTHYTRDHFINDDEINLINTIANQVAIAIHQARLYKTTQELAQRETLLRSITDAMRKSLNFDETKKRIVDIIGETLKADRCFILEYNKENDKILIVNEEYLSSDNILSYKGVDLNEHIPSLVAEFKKGKHLIINESGATLNGEKVDFERGNYEDVRKAVGKYKVNSALVFPLFYSDEFLGDLVLHYVEIQHEIGDDEINFLNLISSQIALALYQSKLYEKVRLQAERERISRNIIEILRSTLDKDMIEHLFVKNIGKYFNADRVFFSEFNKKTNEYLPIDEKSEYLSSNE